ncbi:MAG: aldehyde dehydrogenase family protein, partial [Myxococcaceae bacterium]
AQIAWGAKSIRARGRLVQQMGRSIADSAERISACIAAETGKPDLEALTQEVLGTAHLAHYFGRGAPRIRSAGSATANGRLRSGART